MLSEASARLVQLTHSDEGRRVALVDGGQLRLLATYRSAYAFAKAALDMGWKLRDPLEHGPVRDRARLQRDLSAQIAMAIPRKLRSFRRTSAMSRLGRRSNTRPMALPRTRQHATRTRRSHPRATSRNVVAWRLGRGVHHRSRWLTPPCGNHHWHLHLGPREKQHHRPRIDPRPRARNRRRSASLYRQGRQSGKHKYSSGGAPLLYGLAALEPDHFKFADHHRPWDAHIHFAGARLFSNRPVPPLKEADECEVHWEGLGRPPQNALHAERREEKTIGRDRPLA